MTVLSQRTVRLTAATKWWEGKATADKYVVSHGPHGKKGRTIEKPAAECRRKDPFYELEKTKQEKLGGGEYQLLTDSSDELDPDASPASVPVTAKEEGYFMELQTDTDETLAEALAIALDLDLSIQTLPGDQGYRFADTGGREVRLPKRYPLYLEVPLEGVITLWGLALAIWAKAEIAAPTGNTLTDPYWRIEALVQDKRLQIPLSVVAALRRRQLLEDPEQAQRLLHTNQGLSLV